MQRYFLPLSVLFLLVLTSCGQQATNNDAASLTPQALTCGEINPAYVHKSRFARPPYSEIAGKASANCVHSDNNPTTLSVWVTIDEKVGTSHRVAARQLPIRIGFTRYGQYVKLTQDTLRVFMRCRDGTFRTTLNFSGSDPIQVGPHHSGAWRSIARCGSLG